ncbi:MAG TPA: rod shape-determining protein MreC [Bryobacteraceae bacterium]|nr:rod shape-determining protein MreC [Bryobacteraceae bacterium]
MESFLNRYRNITVLLLVIFAQLVLLAVQVKSDQDIPLIRVWAVTAVMPVARVVEAVRGGITGLMDSYILLHDTHEENRRLKEEVGRLKLDNNALKNQLNLADRAKALQIFQSRTESKTLAASVIASGAGSNSKVVFVDRGSVAGVERGMAVVTPEGIVGKVIAAYPTASEVLLITDPDFAAGVVSQKNQVHGTLKGQGTPTCKVDYVPFEEKVEVGEWFYTSGDDRVFPRGFPVGIVKVVRDAQPFKEILVEPSGLQHGLEDVLIVLAAVHQAIPEAPVSTGPVYIAPPPPGETAQPANPQPNVTGTEADKLRTMYKELGDAQNHKFGEGLPGTKPPDFNIKLPAAGAAQPGTAPKPESAPKPGTPAVPQTAVPAKPPARNAAPASPPSGTGLNPAGSPPQPHKPAQPPSAAPL